MSKRKNPTATPPAWRTIDMPIDCLVDPAEVNPNVMSPDDVARLARNMARTGCVQPIAARVMGDVPDPPDDVRPGAEHQRWIDAVRVTPLQIVDGSHRRDAAAQAGMTTVPVTVVRMSDADARAMRVGMNKIRGELDLGAVGRIFTDLGTAPGYSPDDMAALMALTGFDSTEVTDLIESVRVPDDEADAMASLGSAGESGPATDEPTTGRTFPLEVRFASKADRDRAKEKLKAMSDDGVDLSGGLMAALAAAGHWE